MSILQRLQGSEAFGIKLGLENIRAILQELGDPQNSFPSVLIAGTNGKGSVAAMLAAVLMEHSFKTGLYTSPHLVSVRERIRVQGHAIGESEFERVLDAVFSAADRVLTNPPTYFEVLTAAAMLHFKRQAVEYAVIEVGMGGRYDATNVVSQSLSIITSIDFDHQKYLGNSLAAIAAEKAAISKNGITMITGPLPVEAAAVVDQVCRQTQSTILAVHDSNIVEVRLIEGHAEFLYLPWGKKASLNLRGRYQVHNAAIVLMAADSLGLDQDATLSALSKAEWPGRLEIVPDTAPPLILDCAHNPMGVHALAEFLQDMGWNRVIVLFAAMRDKNFQEMLGAIAPLVQSAFLTTVEPLQRCADGEELIKAATSARISASMQSDAAMAFDEARKAARSTGLPLAVFGSIYLIGKIYSLLGLRL